MAVRGVNQQLSGMTERFSEMRTGIVISVNPFFVIVDVGGTQIDAAYVAESRPVEGVMVCVMRQGASWFVLGTSSATGGNAILNGSFEELAADGLPAFWNYYNVTNTANWSATSDPLAVGDGDTVLEVVPLTSATSTSIVYSSPVDVAPGQTVELSVYVNGYYPAQNINTSGAQLRALWFTDAATLYPTTSAADTLIDSAPSIVQSETLMVSLSGTAVVPAATNVVRLGLRSVVADGAGLHWDYATLRVLG